MNDADKPRIPDLRDEAQDIYNNLHFYIEPRRFNILLRTAARASKVLTDIPEITVSYAEIKFMLQILYAAVNAASEGKEAGSNG